MQQTKIRLVSFSDGPFLSRTGEFIKEAQAMEIFDEIIVFNRHTLDADFCRQHMALLTSNVQGFGYWMWKPQVVKQVLAHSAADDIVIYMDIGCTLSAEARYRLQEYIDIVRDSQWKMLSFQTIYTEYLWTKMDTAKRLGVHESPAILNTSQLGGSLFLLCGTESNRQLINDWLHIATESSYRYLDDTPSELPNHHGFRAHRHDQSIFSLLCKIRGTTITDSTGAEFHRYSASYVKKNLPVMTMRLRGGSLTKRKWCYHLLRHHFKIILSIFKSFVSTFLKGKGTMTY